MAQAASSEKKVVLRVQNPKLTLELTELSLVKEIMDKIASTENISWNKLQLMDRSSFPPKTISNNPYLTLKDANIQSQTVISVRKLDTPQNFDQFKPQTTNNTNTATNPSNPSSSNESKTNNDINESKENNNNNVVPSGTFIREKIPDDNSCLFNAIQMCADETHKLDNDRAMELREMVASIILSDSDTYNVATLEKSNTEYAQWIMNTKSWGGEIELSILSNILELVIVAIDIETLKFFKYGIESGYKKTIFLLYSGIHYDAAILDCDNESSNGNGNGNGNGNKVYKYQFDTSDDFKFAQVLSLAQELNKKKEFTNVYKFTLMCTICGKGIIGQNGALEHAKQTGHTAFEEYKKQ